MKMTNQTKNMEENIVTWDFMGWQETTAPDVGVQLNWNKTLL